MKYDQLCQYNQQYVQYILQYLTYNRTEIRSYIVFLFKS